MSRHLCADFSSNPYWWDAAPPVPSADVRLAPSYDLAVIGSGFTGMRAALMVARAGRSVVVLDKAVPGAGAARRNAGYLGRTLKKSYADLKRHRGPVYARAVYAELATAYETTLDLIEKEQIACHATRCGRLIVATSPAHLAAMRAELEPMRTDLGIDYAMLSRDEVGQEMATSAYHGGAVIPDLGSLHPGLYHQGLLDRVVRAGAVIAGGMEVTSVQRQAGATRFRIATSGGEIGARDVLVATNGYTPRHLRWHARRVIPFDAYMAATEPMPEALLHAVLPHRRTVLDSNLNIDFFRPAPDSPRLLFGGATGSRLRGSDQIAEVLHAILARALPQLAHLRLSHVWTGQCAGTFDMMPHIGNDDGLWYTMGYNFAGVPMGTYLGMKAAEQILGRDEGQTVFGADPFPTAFWYTGNPWFVPLAMRYFDWKDRRKARAASW